MPTRPHTAGAGQAGPEVLEQRRRLPELLRRVRERYLPELPWRRRDPEPLDALIETVLGQQNSPAATGRQLSALKATFASWQEALASGPEAIEDALRGAGGGLARVKADYVWRILDALAGRGALSLAHLHALPDDEVRRALQALPGVGRASASCVMLFDMLRPAMPVDNHIDRVTRRLGLVPQECSRTRMEDWYDGALPHEWQARYTAHVSLIRHGRQVCHARQPECSNCVLRDLCPSAEPV